MRKRTHWVTPWLALSALLVVACSDSSGVSNPYYQDEPYREGDPQAILDEINSNPAEKVSSSSRNWNYSSSSKKNSSSSSEVRSSSSKKNESTYSEPRYPWEEWFSSSSEKKSSSSSNNPISSSSNSSVSPGDCQAIRSTTDKFIPLEDVFDCVQSNEKLVIVIRHGERNKNDDGSNGDLNKNGKNQATYLGKKLAGKSQEEFYYISTKTYRTLNTGIYISKGKGETFLDSATVFSRDRSYHFVKNEDFTEKWYIKGNSDDCQGVKSWARFAKFAYDTTACPNEFYNVDAKTKEVIDKHFMYNDIPNVTVVTTHDKFIAPFLISLTNRKIGLEAHEYVYPNGQYNDWNQNVFKHWPNYLSGVAIIVNENNGRSFVPVRGLNTGYLGYHCLTGTENGYTCSMWEKDVQ